jgi:WD40 repeat protein
MVSLNILSLIIESLASLDIKRVLEKNTNKTLCITTLSLLTFERIFSSMGKSKTISKHFLNPEIGSLLIHLNALNIYSTAARLDMKFAIFLNNTIISTVDGHKLTARNVKNDLSLTIDLEETCKIEIHNLTLISKERLAVAISNENQTTFIKVLDCSDNYKIVKVFGTHLCWVTCLINLSGGKFATSSYDSTIKIWSYDNNTCLHTIQDIKWVFSLAFIKLIGMLLSGGDHKFIKVWDIGSYQCVRVIHAHDRGVVCLLSLPNGFFTSGSYDMRIKIWDSNGFKCINTLEGLESDICTLKLLDDYRLASCTETAVIIWNY